MHFSFTFFICLEIWWLTDFYSAPHAYRPGADISEASLDPVPANFPNLWRTQLLDSSGWNPPYLLMVAVPREFSKGVYLLLLCQGSLQLVVWPSVALSTQSIGSECAYHKGGGGKYIYIYIYMIEVLAAKAMMVITLKYINVCNQYLIFSLYNFINYTSIKKYKVSCEVMSDSVTLWTVCSLPGFSVHGIFQQEYWSWLPFPSPGDLPDPGIEPGSPTLQADSLLSEPSGKFQNHTNHCSLFT